MNLKLLIGIPLLVILLSSCQDAIPDQVEASPYDEHHIAKSDTIIDCSNGKFNEGRLTRIVIHSATERLQNITIRNCELKGSIRMYGLGLTGADQAVRESSRKQGHTERAQAAAPANILISNVTFEEDGDIPVFVSPGVTHVTIENSTFTGKSNSTAIYLAAESGHNRILNNTFDMAVAREVIAVDGSAHNRIANNDFRIVSGGGIYLYRNCGEDGTVRHQSPQYNIIEGNVFSLIDLKKNGWGVWLGSRNGNRKYCGDDSGFPFGSSISDRDYANHNAVRGNIFNGSDRTVLDNGQNNNIQ